MKKMWSMLAVLALFFAFTVSARADDKKVTLKGTITCAKCDLKLEKTCMTVIKVKKDDKDVVYYFDKDAGKKHHKAICTEAKEGEVTGTVSKDGDKMIIKVESVKFKE